MVRALSVFIALILLSACAIAGTRNFRVTAVTVGQLGEFRAGETSIDPALCDQFRPTDRQVLEWLRAAREVTKRDYYAGGIITGCRAAGDLTSGEGGPYRWHLDMGGGAIIEKAPGDPVYLLGEPLPI